MTAPTATPGAEVRLRWECSDCEVVVRHVGGLPLPSPGGWTGGRCLGCHREHRLVGRRGTGADRSELIREELLLGTPFPKIVSTTRSSLHQVRRIQKQMLESGELAPRPKRRREGPTPTEKREANLDKAEAPLRKAGPLTVTELTEHCGFPLGTAKKYLNELRREGRAVQGEKVPGNPARRWSATSV